MTYSMYQERALLYRTLLSFLPSTNPSATRASEWVPIASRVVEWGTPSPLFTTGG